MTARTCTIDGCERPACKRGWCERHYHQWRTHGEQHDRQRGPVPIPAHERILRRVDHTDIGCWVYTGAPNTKRPTVTVGPGHYANIYHVVYEVLVGPVPAGMNLHHTCENPRCVNPEHLVLMTRADHSRHHRTRGG